MQPRAATFAPISARAALSRLPVSGSSSVPSISVAISLLGLRALLLTAGCGPPF